MKKHIIILLLLLCSIFSLFGTYNYNVSALDKNSSIYTNVIEDLSKDTNFDNSKYKEDFSNNSISVISVAESLDKELFIYTYQPNPNKKQLAVSINISLLDNGINYSNYTLEYCSSNGVFFKYKVKDLIVDFTKNLRVYNISSITRLYIKNTDISYEENTITEIAFPVGLSYKFSDINGKYSCICTTTEIINITNMFAGVVEYTTEYFIGYPKTDRHFVAFNTDKDIDKLYKVKLYYKENRIHEYSHTYFDDVKYDIETTINENLYYNSDKVQVGEYWFEYKYNFKRIQSVNEFINDIEDNPIFVTNLSDLFKPRYSINEDSKKLLKNNKWVLSYLESSSYSDYRDFGYDSYYTQVTDIMILELHFETNGSYYEMGVVSHKINENNKPINSRAPNNSLIFLLVVSITIVFVVIVFKYSYKFNS